MTRLLIPLSLIAALALPATAAAASTKADKREGKHECRKLLRAVETRANFLEVVKLEARANSGNAFGRCVKVRTTDATSERRAAFRAAKRTCASPRRARGGNRRGRRSNRGAYGRCVSTAAREMQARLDAEQREATLNPAKACRAKQKANAAAFNAEFPGSNGFRKCLTMEANAETQGGVAPDNEDGEPSPEDEDEDDEALENEDRQTPVNEDGEPPPAL